MLLALHVPLLACFAAVQRLIFPCRCEPDVTAKDDINVGSTLTAVGTDTQGVCLPPTHSLDCPVCNSSLGYGLGHTQCCTCVLLPALPSHSMSGNCLTHIPDSLTQCVHLQDLNLSGNQLAALPDCVGAWTDLQKLSVHGNQLQQLPQQGWEQLQKLDEVCVQGNQLTSLPDGLAKLGVSRVVWGPGGKG